MPHSWGGGRLRGYPTDPGKVAVLVVDVVARVDCFDLVGVVLSDAGPLQRCLSQVNRQVDEEVTGHVADSRVGFQGIKVRLMLRDRATEYLVQHSQRIRAADLLDLSTQQPHQFRVVAYLDQAGVVPVRGCVPFHCGNLQEPWRHLLDLGIEVE